ncbi:MAG: 2,3-bisphosphoglycerate-independent phosphoglycerate mutase [Nitrososphaerota archaeon]|nr:alkaline phosphatase family protein [Nitrososphaerota archaeon]MDG6937102.1 2,3-bisphosphoglycerate-independent phosphoglycerate mutase [Nitrososphaerota archaeon]MDG6971142.1 2,3-bisphosphoglycerate-independent phosphoglycerate mutase [Nitrososphaerota archaeon]MDG6972344.1 2,3-bisphosphoglycerate-independent phosphoglycerate mutase [Nitrososphaerota archaeon]MDG6980080.1 2,3-bisphosphoglycerate-independent phosphoglycerate mutase [Nitrososphaerota archaeon]
MKFGYVLLDGCGDRPVPALNYTTPLEAAYTPNLDRIAAKSRLGTVTTVGKGIAPESDIAVFNMLGYSFRKGYPGRGVVEAVGAGLEVRDGDLAFRANFASARGRRIVDRRAGRDLAQEEGELLAEEVGKISLKGASVSFRTTVSYRGVLVIRARRPLSASVSNTDPAYVRVGGFGAAKAVTGEDEVMRCVPEVKTAGATLAAELVNEFTAKAQKVLEKSEVNKERTAAGKLPANCVLLRDAGDHLPDLPSFEERHGLKGTALVEFPAEIGIAKLLGMKMVPIADRHDIKEKATKFLSEVREGTVVYVHIKGPDEFGHDGDARGKKRSIETIDRDFFSAVKGAAEGFTLGVSCDHATPCAIKMHSDDPVPLLVTGPKGDGRRFTEANAKLGSLGRRAGKDVLDLVTEAPVRRSGASGP